jgi:ketosteroid isomerase-like protein
MSDASLTAGDREFIRALAEDRWTAALIARDLDGLSALCAEDLVYMPADHAALRGRAEFRAWLANFPRVVRMTQPVDAIEGGGDLAMVRARFTVTLEVNGQHVDHAGKALSCVRRDAAGAWQVKSVCFNFDQPIVAPLAGA